MNFDAGRGITFVPIPGAVVPIPSTSVRATGVLHEFVSESQAVEAMQEIAFMVPARPRY